ncbi:MAG: NADH-quinone oxidoreductase subunit M [Chloroflexota bacterium]|nr:NADH-quinone oxidoreductase subunit M [Chloroflexota bacterium]
MYGNNALGFPILSLVTLLPLLGAVIIAFLPRGAKNAVRWTAVATAGIDMLLMLVVLFSYNHEQAGFQFREQFEWAPGLGLQYYMGVDGISILLFFITSLLSLVAIVYSFGNIDHRVKEYYASFLVLETGMLGVFVALDLVLFYVFFELTLIPMALLIGIWGHGRKLYSAVKFFLYTLAGSLVMLGAIISLFVQTSGAPGGPTLNWVDLMRLAPNFSYGFQLWMFWGFFFAFAVKMPLFPFHTWLPDAHVDAPTAGSVILAGVLLKMGGYGFLRWLIPLSPEASRDWAVVPITLSVIAILYGAYVTLVQRDLKKLIAYSSVATMGFVVLGIFTFTTQGVQGAVLQMVSHGFISGALFLGVGVIYERLHTREIARLGGLANLMGAFTALFVLLSLANLGLPGTSAFVSEVLVTLGAFKVNPWLAVPVYAYIIVSAAYMLWMVARVFYLGQPQGVHIGVEANPAAGGHVGGHGHGHEQGHEPAAGAALPGMKLWQEAVPLAGLALLSIFIGVWATPFLETMQPAVAALLDYLGVPPDTGTAFLR